MVVLAQQLVSAGCWKSRKRADWQFQQFLLKAFVKICVRKNGRLCDTSCDLWFVVIKRNTTQNKPFNLAGCSHGFQKPLSHY